MRTRSKFFTFAAALVGLLLIPTAAFAYAPEGDPSITCVAGGDPVLDCVGFPFDPGTDFDWTASHDGGDSVAIAMSATLAATGQTQFDAGSGTVNADGEAVFQVDTAGVPEGADITVSISGFRNGERVTLADAVATVQEDGEVIANAGSDAGMLALGAAGAIALGGAALFISRRKRSATAA